MNPRASTALTAVQAGTCGVPRRAPFPPGLSPVLFRGFRFFRRLCRTVPPGARGRHGAGRFAATAAITA